MTFTLPNYLNSKKFKFYLRHLISLTYPLDSEQWASWVDNQLDTYNYRIANTDCDPILRKSTLTTGLNKLTDFAVVLYSQSERACFLDDRDKVAVTGEKEIWTKALTFPSIEMRCA